MNKEVIPAGVAGKLESNGSLDGNGLSLFKKEQKGGVLWLE